MANEPAGAEIESAVRERWATALANFRAEITRLEDMVRPPAARQVAPGGQPRRLQRLGPGPIALQTPPVPTPGPNAPLEEMLANLVTYGIKQRSYDETDDVIAPDAITATGANYDAKVLWDHWIVNPTVDALISFKGPPSQNTPILAAGLSMNFQIRASKVYYQTAPGVTTQGQLYVRLARYVDSPQR
jgi:hypothetical protein